MDKKLLHILCCPITKRHLEPLSGHELKTLNQRIAEGRARYMDDSPVEESVEEALITDNRSRIYRVDDGIPIMLEERSLPANLVDRDPEGG